MKNLINIFLTSVMFYSRIPVPKLKEFKSEWLTKSTWFLPLIGLMVGILTALVFVCFSFVLTLQLAILLSMAFSVYLTGAFHEDGFADFCDGFGGGYTKEKVLTIMKDSRIGTYGSLGLIFMLATKFFSLSHLNPEQLAGIIISGHAISRIPPVIMIYVAQYVRIDESSKSKPIGEHSAAWGLVLAIFFGLIPILWINYLAILLYLAVLLPVFILYRHYIIKKIGGYTGDVLGALQQIAELVFYLTLIIFQNTDIWNL